MRGSPLFDWLATQLEQHTELRRLEARGTMRITLKAAGLDARSLNARQVQALVEHVLGEQLRCRGIPDAERVCQRILGDLPQSPAAGSAPNSRAEGVFRRILE